MTRTKMSDHPPACPGPQAHVTPHGHTSCKSHVKETRDPKPGRRTRAAGEPCLNPPKDGQLVCAKHGANAKQNLRKAEERIAEGKARAQMARLGLPEPVKISHTEAMIWLVSAKYAEVCWLREQVQAIDPADLVWGKIRNKEGGDDRGTTYEAKPNIWWVMLRSAEDQLVTYAKAAHAAGVDDAHVDLAKQRGLLLGQFLDSLMAALCAWLINAGVTRENFPGAWAAGIADLFPKHIRTLGGAA